MTLFNFFDKKKHTSPDYIPEKKGGYAPVFSSTEKLFVIICIIMLFADILISTTRNINIAYDEYSLGYVIPFFLMLVGQFYRIFRPDESIARPFIYFSLFFVFSSTMSAFNHLLLPGLNLRIDPLLQSIDQAMGFYWLDVARMFSQWPAFCAFLLKVYQSSLIQMVAVVLFLGYFRKDRSLNNFFFTCIFAGMMTIGFWCFFPSSGPSSTILQYILPEQFPMFLVNHEYGQRMNDVFANGMDIISPKQTLGLVSFPSFHTVMALMCVVYSRPLKWVFPVFVVLNIFMIPAVIIHGSHYLVDLIGGVVVFTFAAWLTSKLVKKIDPTLQDHANHKTAPLQ